MSEFNRIPDSVVATATVLVPNKDGAIVPKQVNLSQQIGIDHLDRVRSSGRIAVNTDKSPVKRLEQPEGRGSNWKSPQGPVVRKRGRGIQLRG